MRLKIKFFFFFEDIWVECWEIVSMDIFFGKEGRSGVFWRGWVFWKGSLFCILWWLCAVVWRVFGEYY